MVCSCSNGLKEIGLLIQSVLKVSAIDLGAVADQESLIKKRLSKDKKQIKIMYQIGTFDLPHTIV